MGIRLDRSLLFKYSKIRFSLNVAHMYMWVEMNSLGYVYQGCSFMGYYDIDRYLVYTKTCW